MAILKRHHKNQSVNSILLLTALFCAVFPVQSRAQSCDVYKETIQTYKRPDFGSYNLWDRTVGEIGAYEDFTAAAPLFAIDGYLLAGARQTHEGAPALLYLVGFDKRGRDRWEKVYDIPGFQRAIKILPYHKVEDGQKPDEISPELYAVFVNLYDDVRAVKQLNARRIGMIIIDEKGEKLDEKIIEDPKKNIQISDVIEALDGRNFVLAAGGAPVQRTRGAVSGELFLLSPEGKVLKKRAFQPGLENEFNSVQSFDGRSYVVSGYLRTEGGRKAGWLARVGSDFELVWQQQYPRGVSAVIRGATPFQGQYILSVGTVAAPGEHPNGGWVMLVDAASAKVEWQRYYQQGDMHLDGLAIDGRDDGIISILLQAEPTEESLHAAKMIDAAKMSMQVKQPGIEENPAPPSGEADGMDMGENLLPSTPDYSPYVMAVTLSPRGGLLHTDTYFAGEGAWVSGWFMGEHSERIMYGSSLIEGREDVSASPPAQDGEVKNPDDTGSAPDLIKDRQGWLLAGEGAERYKDPCIQPVKVLP